MASLQESGYNYQFVSEPPDSLKCLICLSVVKEPQQHAGCGKLFCKVCIDHYKLHSNLWKDCPYCRKPMKNLFIDQRSEQEVRSLIVHCTSRCGWTGELRQVEHHELKDCPNTLVPCPLGCKNGSTKIIRRNKDYHLEQKCPNRSYSCEKCKKKMVFKNANSHKLFQCPKREHKCPHCKKVGEYDERTTTHLTVCPKVEIKCSKCSTKILRCDQFTHTEVCEYEPVNCTYHNIGCEEKTLRKDLPQHEENAQHHLSLATKEVLRLKNTISLFHKTLKFQMKNFKENKSKGTLIHSPSFFTSTRGYKLCALVVASGLEDGAGTHVSAFACLMKGDHDDTLTWPFTGSVTVELLNQLENRNHYKHTLTFPVDRENSQRVTVDGERGIGWGWPQFIPHDALDYNAIFNTQYLKDDTLVFRVSAEAPDHKPWLDCIHTV